MRKKISATSDAETAAARQRLSDLRLALLGLHKALVDCERVGYEKTVGEIKSPNHFLQLLINDPWFAWLKPLSQLIVSMDEALDGKEPLTVAGAEVLVKQSALLLAPAENTEGYAGHYFNALQREPDVVLAHAKAVKLVSTQKK
jgi:hypothetical protein